MHHTKFGLNHIREHDSPSATQQLRDRACRVCVSQETPIKGLVPFQEGLHSLPSGQFRTDNVHATGIPWWVLSLGRDFFYNATRSSHLNAAPSSIQKWRRACRYAVWPPLRPVGSCTIAISLQVCSYKKGGIAPCPRSQIPCRFTDFV